MVPEDDARVTIEYEDHFVIQPTHSFWNPKAYLENRPGQLCDDGFEYSSGTNTWWLTEREIADLVDQVEEGIGGYDLPAPTEPRFIVGG